MILRAMLAALTAVPAAATLAVEPPPLPREFRGVWVATVANIDWPSKPGLPVERQKAELVAILDRAKALNLNAVVFQVRPAGDALYASDLEPWSHYLTGEQGKAPSPFYDPLALAVAEAHARGIELHAWFNPFRARHAGTKGELAPTHLARKRPNLVKPYGKYLWMDPGEPAVRDHSLAVIADVVRRYDVDGVHLDDYFYPYKERDAKGKAIDFPDDASYARYRASGGMLARDDWRRANVDGFVRRHYEQTKAAKPWVKVGLSPFGIWRPGNPPSIRGLDPYAELYADSRKWLREGWCDYFSPQLYWPVGQVGQDFPTLLGWWADQNVKGRHLWPGLFTSKVGGGAGSWEASVITRQIEARRAVSSATGEVHFSMKALMTNRPGLDAALSGLYDGPALVPASPWLGAKKPTKPTLRVTGQMLAWGASGDAPRFWAVQTRSGNAWTTHVLPGSRARFDLPTRTDAAAVTAVDRFGNASVVATWTRK